MSAPTGQRVWRVLVVDDEENLNWSLVNSLRKDNYAADGALTGDDALRRMASQHYDIVISDVKMPGMDGFELLQWLRANRPQTRVVMMTAFGSPSDRAHALRSGVIAYLEKPFDLRALKDELLRLTTPPSGQRANGQSENEGYDLLEVGRVISLARRDIALLVETGGRTGRLRFLRGDLIWAEAGDLTGDDAFIALTAPRSGRVQPEPWDGRSGRNVTQPISQLIHLAMAQRDRQPSADMGGPPTRPGSRGTPPPAAPAQPSESRITPHPAPASEASGFVPSQPQPAPSPVGPPPSTAALSPLSPAQTGAARAVLDDLGAQLPESAGAVLLRPDGTVVAQHWVNAEDAAGGTLGHLASCVQAALRALLLGGWGDLDDVLISSQDRNLLLRRVGRTDRAALFLLVVPRDMELDACRALLHEREDALVEALR
ncbi:MAG TPA: response regulator [Ktedonobacterales bacterium]